jgi:hypothetical protein
MEQLKGSLIRGSNMTLTTEKTTRQKDKLRSTIYTPINNTLMMTMRMKRKATLTTKKTSSMTLRTSKQGRDINNIKTMMMRTVKKIKSHPIINVLMIKKSCLITQELSLMKMTILRKMMTMKTLNMTMKMKMVTQTQTQNGAIQMNMINQVQVQTYTITKDIINQKDKGREKIQESQRKSQKQSNKGIEN